MSGGPEAWRREGLERLSGLLRAERISLFNTRQALERARAIAEHLSHGAIRAVVIGEAKAAGLLPPPEESGRP